MEKENNNLTSVSNKPIPAECGIIIRKRSIAERDRLVTDYHEFVSIIAKEFVKKSKCSRFDYDDLLQAGYLALINAAEKFDETTGYKFATYARICIRNAMKKERSQIRSLIHTPASKVREQKAKSCAVISIDDYDEDDEIRPNRISNLVICDETDMSDYDILNIECQALYDAALATLNDRERTALEMRLGLNDSDVYSSKEIGEILGVGEERVRQLIKSAKRKLRDYFATLSPAA